MVLAKRGLRDLDDGEVVVEDEEERRALQEQARGVWARTFLTASLATAAIYLLPL